MIEEEDDGGINVEDGMEMAPSETSSMHEENNKQYMNRMAVPNTPYTNSSSQAQLIPQILTGGSGPTSARLDENSRALNMPISNQPSALVRQLSDKVRTQAERLTSLDAYRVLLERRLLDLDPKHPLPVLP